MNHCPALKGFETEILLTQRARPTRIAVNHCPALKGFETSGQKLTVRALASVNHCPALKGFETWKMLEVR